MNYMKEILSEMRKRPGMYISECNLDNLRVFMNGYMYQIFQEDDIVPEFYAGFQEYIEEIYHIKTGQHWTKILNFYSDSEKEAFDKFFLHLEEFTKMDRNIDIFAISKKYVKGLCSGLDGLSRRENHEKEEK